VNMMMNNPAHAGELVSEWLDGLKEEGQAITITELAERIQVTLIPTTRNACRP
jgi:antitoxin HigA-1